MHLLDQQNEMLTDLNKVLNNTGLTQTNTKSWSFSNINGKMQIDLFDDYLKAQWKQTDRAEDVVYFDCLTHPMFLNDLNLWIRFYQTNKIKDGCTIGYASKEILEGAI